MLKMGLINIAATSRIDGMDVAYYSASFSSDGNGNESFNENITNVEVYAANQAVCDADYAAFKETARETAAQIRNTAE